MTFLKSVIFLLYASQSTMGVTMDHTSAPFSNLTSNPVDIIEATLYKIRQSATSGHSYHFMIWLYPMAMAEVYHCQLNDEELISHGLCDGLWQLSQLQLDITKDVVKFDKLKEVHEAIFKDFHIIWQNVTLNDLKKPIYSALGMFQLITTLPNYNTSDMFWLRESQYRLLRPELRLSSDVLDISYYRTKDPLYTKAREVSHFKLDIIFVIDELSSENAKWLKRVAMYVPAMLIHDLVTSDSYIGIVVYAAKSEIVLPLTSVSSFEGRDSAEEKFEELQDAIIIAMVSSSNISTGAQSRMSEGMNAAINMFQLNPRHGAKKVMYIMTNGNTTHSNDDKNATLLATKTAQENGITIQATAAGLIPLLEENRNKLLDTVGGKKEHLFEISDDYLSAAGTIRSQIILDISQLPVQIYSPREREVFTGVVDKDEKHYFKYYFNSDANSVLVNLIPTDPTPILSNITSNVSLVVHYSYTFPIPSSAIYDGVLWSNSNSSLEIKSESMATDSNENYVYISVESVNVSGNATLSYELIFDKNARITSQQTDLDPHSNIITPIFIGTVIVLILLGVSISLFMYRKYTSNPSRFNSVKVQEDGEDGDHPEFTRVRYQILQ